MQAPSDRLEVYLLKMCVMFCANNRNGKIFPKKKKGFINPVKSYILSPFTKNTQLTIQIYIYIYVYSYYVHIYMFKYFHQNL